ncbi:MAG TPA: long-chain-fatty-acid--CoA ligase [Burkholderiaceae bacterium]|nr:long-chain-fatty-acid--CoA ligase [Burkholderiaceae bacterium]HRA79337.1 long-chain-fatty-acid--CoA ligase [Burkholderiaceae bacterium]
MPAVTLHHRFWPPGRPLSLDYPQRSLYENLRLSAQRHPTRSMIVFHGASIDYASCLDRVDRLAGFLQHDCGVARGDRVLLYLQNSPQWILAYYAILRADAMVVPVNAMLRAAELAHVAADSGAAVAFAAQDLVAELPPDLRRTIVVTYRDCAGDAPSPEAPEAVRAAPLPLPASPAGAFVRWTDALAAGRRPDAHLAGPGDLAVMPYSSGTTGRPKGCVHTHRSAMATALMHARWGDWGDAPVVLATLPLFHVTGMQSNMNAPILLGATIVLLQRWDRDAAAAAIERHRVTSWGCITTMAIDLLSAPGIERRDLSSLRRIGGGGAAMPAAIAARLRELTGLEYIEGYGLSETIAPTHINPPHRAKRQCAGVPLFDVDARVVDPVSLRELAPNETGEIVVHGPQLFTGYWNDPRATAEALVEIDAKRFLRTGDIGHYDDDGYFFVTDRLKRMINAAGFKVWPAEVEAMMYAHPEIQEACVIAAHDERRGETVKAVVVLRPGAAADAAPAAIAAWCREHMAAYKVPRIVEVVDALPRSATGKVMWRDLQERESRQDRSEPTD